MCFPSRGGQSKGLPRAPLPPCPPGFTWCLCGARLELACLPGFWFGSGVTALSQRFPLVALHLTQSHTSTTRLAALSESRERQGIVRGGFLFFHSSQVRSSSEASQSLLWTPFLRFGSNPIMLPFCYWRRASLSRGWGRAREEFAFIFLMQLGIGFALRVDAVIEDGENGCCEPGPASPVLPFPKCSPVKIKGKQGKTELLAEEETQLYCLQCSARSCLRQ